MSLFKDGEICSYYLVGNLYYFGCGVKKDINKAILWYEKSAKEGDGDACIKLGDLYFYGDGVEKDIKKAIGFYKIAAEQAIDSAIMKLEDIYYFCDEIDDKESIKMFCDNDDVFEEIGHLFSNGYGVEKDINKAISWYEKAGLKVCESSTDNVIKMNRERKRSRERKSSKIYY